MNSYGYLKASSIAICNQKVHETVPITSLATLDYDSLRPADSGERLRLLLGRDDQMCIATIMFVTLLDHRKTPRLLWRCHT